MYDVRLTMYDVCMCFDMDIHELAQQLKKPSGDNGVAVGKKLIEHNREKNNWLLSLLLLRNNQQILEIGFGPGESIYLLSQQFPDSTIYGIEISETMIEMATERNADSIASGIVHLSLSDASCLAFSDATFDIVYLSNVIQFWDNLSLYFSEIYRCLKEGGVYGFYHSDPSTWTKGIEETGVFIPYSEQHVIEALEEVGFHSIEIAYSSGNDKKGIVVIASK